MYASQGRASWADEIPGHAPRLCGRCMTRPPAFMATRAPLLYRGEVRTLMQRFKFDGDRRSGQMLLSVFLQAESIRDAMGHDNELASHLPEALVAVPLHSGRARQRGFNQAHWLATRLADRLDIPLMIARRRRDDLSQRKLTRAGRQRNLRGAFEVAGSLPRHIALVDDVMTTGATLDSLARACRRAGAKRIEAWVMARTPR